MNKVYSRINWENYPSDKTPLNESNLNKVDYAVNEIDNRIVSLDSSKLDKTTANSLVKSVTYNSENGIFTITYLNGSKATFDTKLEKLAVNFSYDAPNERLIITLDDGTKQYVDLSSLITEHEFMNTDTVSFVIEGGKVKANINKGSVTGDMLQPNYLTDITVQAKKAEKGASDSAISAGESELAARRAEKAAENAESVVGVGVATTEKAGIVKPDGNTLAIDADGTICVNSISTKNIANGEDLNDFLTPGQYVCAYVSIAQSLLNCPTEIAFSMEVYQAAGAKNNSVTQIIMESTSVSPKMFSRNIYNANVTNATASVGKWNRIYTTADPPPATTITNNLLATVPGTALDAVQGGALDRRINTNADSITELNRKLYGMQICSGVAMVTNASTAAVEFPPNFFSRTPFILVNPKSTIDGTIARVQYGTDSKTGFSIRLESSYSGQTPVNWIAMGL